MTLDGFAAAAELAARALALAGAALASVVALTHWAVRQRRLQPFGAWPRLVRQVSDPLLRPIERGLLRRGGNAQDASIWLVGAAVVAGLGLVLVVRWLIGLVYSGLALAAAPPSVWLRLAVGGVFDLLMLALFARFVARWFGVSPAAAGMRLLAGLTEWFLRPIRRALPPTGLIDATPLVGYLLLLVLRTLVISAVFGR